MSVAHVPPATPATLATLATLATSEAWWSEAWWSEVWGGGAQRGSLSLPSAVRRPPSTVDRRIDSYPFPSSQSHLKNNP